MFKTATLALNPTNNKWEAKFEGRLVAASFSKDYVITSIESGKCNKAKMLGVTKVVEADHVPATLTVNGDGTFGFEETPEIERFTVNERFQFLGDLTSMVADRTSPSLIVAGEGGLGKTHTVMEALEAAGLENSETKVGMATDDHLDLKISRSLYTVVKGYSTPKGLFRTLYENRNRLVVFDDTDSVLKVDVAVNLLKAALDSYDSRIISWNAESFGTADDLPKSFEFTGGIIFISNMRMSKIDQAIRSRSLCVDLSMTVPQKIERMGALIELDTFMPGYAKGHKAKALEFIDENQAEASEISLRTLIQITKIVKRGGDWKKLASYVLTARN